jgi:hypothetical protein
MWCGVVVGWAEQGRNVSTGRGVSDRRHNIIIAFRGTADGHSIIFITR